MFGVVACFSLFWTATAFALGYGTTILGYSRASFLTVELGAILFMAAAIITASWLSDRLAPERVLIVGCAGTIIAESCWRQCSAAAPSSRSSRSWPSHSG